MKHLFFDDYSEGAHPAILAALAEHNDGQEEGYGLDGACRLAARRIAARFGVDADVHFVSGATQANLVAIAAMLRSYEGIVAPGTGHIVVHETGAIEATGHRIVTVDGVDGKLTPQLLDVALESHQDEHTVMPAAVFLTQATEVGTVYRGRELAAVATHAKRRGLRVFVDGARLAMALASPVAAMTPAELAGCGIDAFTVGGTKVGGMFGEAIVIVDGDLRHHFRYHMKQRGALLAKGRFLGAQFARFFDVDDLWLELGRQSNAKAARLAGALQAVGVTLAHQPEANQVFVALADEVIRSLAADYGFHVWSPGTDGSSVIRLVCSWATPSQAIDGFVEDVAALLR